MHIKVSEVLHLQQPAEGKTEARKEEWTYPSSPSLSVRKLWENLVLAMASNALVTSQSAFLFCYPWSLTHLHQELVQT